MPPLRSSWQDFGGTFPTGGGPGHPGTAAFVRSMRAYLFLFLLGSLAACNRNKAPPPPPVPVAAVADGTSIPVATVQREIDRLRRGAGTAVVDGLEAPQVDVKDVPRLGRALLDPLVDRVLLVGRAKVAGMTVSDAEVQRAMDALTDSARASGQTLAERLAQDGQTPDGLAEETRDRLLAEKWVAEQTRGERPSAAEARAYFETHRSEFDTPEQAHALQILVTTAEEGLTLQSKVASVVQKGASAREQLVREIRRVSGARGGDGSPPRPSAAR